MIDAYKLFDVDVGGLQVCPYPQEDSEGEARHAAVVRVEAVEDADEVPWETVEEVKHEDHERHLHQGQAQTQR